MRRTILRTLKRAGRTLVAVGGGLLLASAPALACATCYTSALGEKGIHALKSGILILLLPTVTIFGALMLFIFRYRDSCPSWRRPGQEEPQFEGAQLQEIERALHARPPYESGGAPFPS